MVRNICCFMSFIVLISLFVPACVSAEPVSGTGASIPTAMPGATVTVSATAIFSPTIISATSTPDPTAIPVISTPSATTTCGEKTGSLERGVIETRLLDKPMSFIVYLPPCYTADTGKHYPVLYLLHGQGFTEEQWIRIGAVSTANQLISTGESPSFIMVFPFDYSYKQPTEYGFEEVFIQLLVPQIDASYRTLKNAASRAIGGLSRGGAWALHIGALHPDMFGAIGGHSASIFYSDENLLPRSLLAIPATQMPRIWLDAGDRDSELELILPFEAFLTENGILHEWHKYVGAHDENYWSMHVNQYLRWYAQDWR
jgi:enterochelin esterase-like enzyme